MTRRGLAVAAAAALTFTLTTTASHATTTNIGAVNEINGNQAPNPATVNGFNVQTATVPTHSYDVPAGYGVITAFRHRTGTASGTLTFKVYRPTGLLDTFFVVASEPRAVTAGTTHTFPVRIPVKPGDKLGLGSSTGVQEAYTGTPQDTLAAFDPTDPAAGSTVTGVPFSGYRLDVAAVVESDADGDGYGDDTQDGCTTDARTFGKCADATVTKAPKKTVLTGGNKAKVKIKFTTADPGGTVVCSIDGKAFKSCKSPFKKRYKLGKHKVVIKAINAQGIEDATPSVVKFKVKQRP
jgi:hypothetical protein